MKPSRSSAERLPVTEAKLRALIAALAEDPSEVVFHNGSRIRRRRRSVRVNRRPGAALNYEAIYGLSRVGIIAAYDYALNGETEEERARRAPGRPFWFRPDRPQPEHPEWEECPF